MVDEQTAKELAQESINRLGNVKGNRPKCPFCNSDMDLENSILKDNFEGASKVELQKWTCPNCGFIADFEFDLTDQEFGDSYRKRGNTNRIVIDSDKILKDVAAEIIVS